MNNSEYIQDNYIIHKLMRIPALKSFKEGNIRALLKLSNIKKFNPGELIFEEGSCVNHMYCLVSGKTKIVKDGQKLAVLKRKGDVFGEMDPIKGSAGTSSVYAVDETVCFEIDISKSIEEIGHTHFPDAGLSIIKEGNCPLYKKGDILKLSGNTLSLPKNKPACFVLVKDINNEFTKYHFTKKEMEFIFECNGCEGSIQLECKVYKKDIPTAPVKKDDNIIDSLLCNLPFFETLNEQDMSDLSAHIKLRKFDKGETIISKGDSGENLFIVASGEVEVIGEGDLKIACLRSGEIFGEMSLLTGDPIGATVKVVESSWISYMSRVDFMHFIKKFPSLQMHLLGLLVRRLAKSNIERSKDLSFGMYGNLTAIRPEGLFQLFNFVQKTGKLTLELPQGDAEVSFRDGELIGAKYKQKEGEEAFYEILKEQEGRFKYKQELSEKDMKTEVIGDFMGLLMEGLRRMDEEKENNST